MSVYRIMKIKIKDITLVLPKVDGEKLLDILETAVLSEYSGSYASLVTDKNIEITLHRFDDLREEEQKLYQKLHSAFAIADRIQMITAGPRDDKIEEP